MSAKHKKTGIARILELAKDRREQLVLSGILSSLSAIASFVPYIAIYFIIRQVIGIYPNFTLLDTVAVTGYGMMAIIGVALNVGLYFAASLLAHYAAFGTLYRLKLDFASHLSRIPLGFHMTLGSGRLRKVMDEDIEKIETFLAHQFPDLVASITAPAVMLVLLFVFDWRFGLAALAVIVLAFVLQFASYGKDSAQLAARLQKTQGNMSEAAVEYIRGMPVLKAFGQTERSFKRLFASIKQYTSFMLEYTFKWENSTSAFHTIISNAYLLILPVGILIGMYTQDYAAYALTFMFYLLFVPSMSSVMEKIMYVSSSGMQVGSGVATMDSIMEIPEIPQPKQPQIPSGGDVVFNDVCFAYEKGSTMALDGVSFTAREGKVTAIVGASGGGKSTIAHLVPRFWDVTAGAIQIGGVDIREMSQQELMCQVSFVFQDSFLFKQSVRENIRMGSPDKDDQLVEDAAKAAQCHDFIMTLPQGYDTVVGSKGVHFSGGEKQRVAIARAIVKDAPVLVLDEATAFADPENEHLIQKALAQLIKEKTVIMIAHRLRTITKADQIIVLDKGHITEWGTHKELLQAKGSYATMWDRYMQSTTWKISNTENAEEAQCVN